MDLLCICPEDHTLAVLRCSTAHLGNMAAIHAVRNILRQYHLPCFVCLNKILTICGIMVPVRPSQNFHHNPQQSKFVLACPGLQLQVASASTSKWHTVHTHSCLLL